MKVCPACSGSDATELGDGTFECRTLKVVAVAPPGSAGNASAVPQPLYDVCRTRYTADAGRQAAKSLVERRQRGAEESARRAQDKRDEERRLRESVGPNRKRSGQLAAQLIQAYPDASRSVVRLIEFEMRRKGWVLTRTEIMRAWAEVDRAWPVGEVGITEPGGYHTTRTEYREAGALPSGRIVLLRGGSENIFAGPVVAMPLPAEYRIWGKAAGDENEYGVELLPIQLQALRERLEEQAADPEPPSPQPEGEYPPPFSAHLKGQELRNHLGPAYFSKRPGRTTEG